MLIFHYLEDGGSVRSPPGIQEIVFARRDEPLARRGEFQRQHARLVQVQLVLVRFQRVEHLHHPTLHLDHKFSQFTSGLFNSCYV